MLFDEHRDFKDRPHVMVSDCFDKGWTLVIEREKDGPWTVCESGECCY